MRNSIIKPSNKLTQRANGTIRIQTFCPEETLTQQHHKDACDVNNIIAKYKQTGEFLHVNKKQGQYADVSNVKDYQSALDSVIKAQNAFAALPAATRKRFNNDPQELLQFLQDKNNYDEALKLGLVEPKLTSTLTTQTTQNQKTNTNKNLNQNTNQKTKSTTQTTPQDPPSSNTED